MWLPDGAGIINYTNKFNQKKGKGHKGALLKMPRRNTKPVHLSMTW
jgi:hypothetical protein